tara:strand:- start:1276 stop:1614 length:339 start_codon:yes stop_codon:yes gene_type:complete
MNLINTLILWIWVLGISLLIPISLPAGGVQKAIIEERKNKISSPLIALKEFNLLATINDNTSILSRVKSGTPVKVVQVWESPKSETWLLVNVMTSSSHQLFLKRGWVNLGVL